MFGRKTFFILGAGAGYVLGAKAGTQRYEQIAGLTKKVNSDPRVKKACETVSHLGGDVLGDAVGKISDKLPDWAPGHRHADSLSSANGHSH
jgi:hypothetical protein